MSEEQKQEVKEDSRFMKILKSIGVFFKNTDFELSVKNPAIIGNLNKEKNGISVGVDQDGLKTNVEYKDSKIKVSHEMTGKKIEEESDDSKDS